MVNKVILVGNVGKDPEIKSTQDGRKIATFSVATSERWKDKNTGEKKERTEWHNVVCFNENLAGIIEQYVEKGSKIYVEGKMSTRMYEKDGQKHYPTEVVLQGFDGRIELLGSKGDGGGRPAPSEDQYGSTKSRSGTTQQQDDEIPF